jgi:hypothetical protein
LQLQSERLCLALDLVVLVLDGYLNCGNSDRGSRRFAGTCGPMGRIAILEQIEHEHEKQPEQNHAA